MQPLVGRCTRRAVAFSPASPRGGWPSNCSIISTRHTKNFLQPFLAQLGRGGRSVFLGKEDSSRQTGFFLSALPAGWGMFFFLRPQGGLHCSLFLYSDKRMPTSLTHRFPLIRREGADEERPKSRRGACPPVYREGIMIFRRVFSLSAPSTLLFTATVHTIFPTSVPTPRSFPRSPRRSRLFFRSFRVATIFSSA